MLVMVAPCRCGRWVSRTCRCGSVLWQVLVQHQYHFHKPFATVTSCTLQVWETGAWGHATWERPQASALCGAQWAADGRSLLLAYSSAQVVQLTFVDEAPSLEGVLAPAQLPNFDASGAPQPQRIFTKSCFA